VGKARDAIAGGNGMSGPQVGSGDGGVVGLFGSRALFHWHQGALLSLLVGVVERMGLGSGLGGWERWRRPMMAPPAAMAWSIFKLAWGMVGWWVFFGVRPFSHRRQGSGLGGWRRWRRPTMVPLAAMARLIFELARGTVGWWVYLGVRLLSHQRRGMLPSLLVDIVEMMGLASGLGVWGR
jgi:hypothetical protein